MQTYLVGGAVRDKLLGRAAGDRDHVVVGGSPERMLALGYRPVGKDFPVFLEPLIEFALANETPAERKLKLFHGAWGGSVDPVFREFAY